MVLLNDEELEQIEKESFGKWQKTQNYKEALKSQFHFDILRNKIYREAHVKAQLAAVVKWGNELCDNPKHPGNECDQYKRECRDHWKELSSEVKEGK